MLSVTPDVFFPIENLVSDSFVIAELHYRCNGGCSSV